jgi:type IV secretory pathway protease TraF
MTRFGLAVTTYVATLSVGLTSVLHPAPKLLWNASASVPIGLYTVRRALPLYVGELVVVQPPRSLAQFFAARRYLPLGVPLVKHILALSGQTVCRSGIVGRADPIWTREEN